MIVKMLMTKLDGIQPFYYWERSDFEGRRNVGYSLDSGKVVFNIPIPDHVIVCDFCNVPIVKFPVPVFRNSYTLCPTCFDRVVQ